MALPVNFDADSAARIYRAVREVERDNRDQKPLTFRRVQEPPPGRSVRMATFTGEWEINSLKTVTLYQAGNTAATFVVNNIVMPVPDPDADADPEDPASDIVCVIAKDRGTWFLVNVQMSAVDMIQSASLQPTELRFERRKIVAVGGTQTTTAIAITECDNEAASAEQLNWFFG